MRARQAARSHQPATAGPCAQRVEERTQIASADPVAAFLIIRVRQVPIMEAYGRQQDASDAWDHAIKVVKAVLIDVVVPKKRTRILITF